MFIIINYYFWGISLISDELLPKLKLKWSAND